MTGNVETRYKGYEDYYLDVNKHDDCRYKRYAKDCNRKFGLLLDPSRMTSALDVGCATGLMCSYLKNRGFREVVGVDLNEQLIEVARKNVDAEFVVSNACDFLKTGRQFDVIFMMNILEHFDRDQLPELMTSVLNSLKPGGFAIVRTPNMSHVMAAGNLADDFTHCIGLTERSISQLGAMVGFSSTEMLNQFRMQNFKGRIKAVCNRVLHELLWWMRGGSKPSVCYRNLYVRFVK